MLLTVALVSIIAAISACKKNATEQQPPAHPSHIVYTDIKPDKTTNIYNLDLNNDGTIDFVIENYAARFQCNFTCTRSVYNNYLEVSPAEIYAGNQIADIPTAINYSANKLIWSTAIDSAMPWGNAPLQNMASKIHVCVGNCKYSDPITSGAWNQSGEGYLGLKLLLVGTFTMAG
jgi:hypothetical protein